MRKIISSFFLSVILYAGLFITMPQEAKNCPANNTLCFKQNVQLQLFDSFGLPVDGTQFWITVNVIKNGPEVTLQLPLINFQTGPASSDDPFPALIPGGYLYTIDGYLPASVRPNDLVYRSIIGASNNGQSLPYSFNDTPAQLPVPPAGYIVSITNQGGLAIQCAGTFGNIIPPGPQILMPCDITYIPKQTQKLCKNYIVDPGFTDITQFTGGASGDYIRDFHVNDAYNGVVAWTWTSNSNIPDKTNGTLNAFVAVGKVSKNGTLTIGTPVQLTDLATEFMAWDTSVAINRTNPDNIIVSWGLDNHTVSPRETATYRAVSFDGGKTWPINGPTNIQPTGFVTPGVPGGFGDNPGVKSDNFGNIWYCTTNFNDNSGNLINQPTFWVSTDGGDTYSVIYTVPAPDVANGFIYDFPSYCFGGDQFGNYGLWFQVDYVSFNTSNDNPAYGFIPITGVGSFGTTQFVQLTSLLNVQAISSITASADGRVWAFGGPGAGFGPTSIPGPGSAITSLRTIYKSPGAIDQNYAGPWDFAITNNIQNLLSVQIPLISSMPNNTFATYFNSVQTNIYDEQRQALYQFSIGQFPDFSQNMRLYFAISRDNGQTWSDPIDIASTDFANRGFQSMALDTVTGDLVFGWYDGRNDPNQQKIQYFAAIIPSKQLDALVNAIPLSNPVFQLGSAA